MLKPAFSLSLNTPIKENLVCCCNLDQKNSSLIGISVGGKAFVYTPQGIQSSEQNINYLNINKSIKSIAVGNFDKDS